jgi:hypothetical protein
MAVMVAMVAWHAYDLSPDGLADRSGRLKGADFLQFYTYGQLVATGQRSRIYEPGAHAEMARTRVDSRLVLSALRPNYAPVVAWLSAPMTGLPFLTALWIFSVASAALYLAAVVGLGRHTGRLGIHLGSTIAIAVGWPTLFVTLRYGQVSAVALALMSAAAVLFSRSQWVASGLALGLLVYKPNLLVVPVLVFAVTQQWRLLGGLLAGAAGELALSLSVVGPAVMRQYVEMLASLARHPELVQMYPAESHSLRGFARLLAPWPPLVDALGLLAIPAAVWLTVRVWRAHDDWRPRWAALVTATLLASPHLLTYDLLILAVPIVLVVDWLLERHGAVPRGAWRWGLALLFVGAWPGPLMAEIYHVQASTLGMSLLLLLLVRWPPSLTCSGHRQR